MNKTNKTLKETITFIKGELIELYPTTEIESFIYLIFDHLLNYSKIDIHLNSDKNLSENITAKVSEIVSDLKNHNPIQYILGEIEFYDLTFKVAPGVLIPRQETEELVHMIINDFKSANKELSILDIGTGSGCIAISLANNISGSTVNAYDISDTALKIANDNAELNRVNVEFKKVDILEYKDQITDKKFDIIVSNPPYVRELEKKMMQNNVLDYEPDLALFVPDNDPLKFYIAITEFAKVNLNKGGYLYFEINEYLPEEMKKMLSEKGFNSEVYYDLNDKARMMKASIISE
jgi:release factor glutamine methyltransferase